MVPVVGTQRWYRIVLVAGTTKRWCRGAATGSALRWSGAASDAPVGRSGVPVDRDPALRCLRRHYVKQVACKAAMARNTGSKIRAFPTAFLQEKPRLKEIVNLRED